jgi:hypothetical protein
MAESALVVVGAITLLAIWYQARETSRSARAAQKSVELQETLHQQWVDVEHWKGEADLPSEGKQVRLLIGFDVLNPTSMPLTLDSIQATITSSHNTEKFEQTVKNTLTPKKAYAVTIVVMPPPEEVSRLLESGLQFTVSGHIRYTDAFEKRRRRFFAMRCAYSARGASFTPWEGSLIKEPTDAARLPEVGDVKSRTRLYAHGAYDSALRFIDHAKSIKKLGLRYRR